MAEKTLLLPRLGETMIEGTIIAWQKQPGESFRRGESLLELETDKMAVEVPALEDGEMVAHLAAAGDVVAIDAPIATIRGVEDAAAIAVQEDAPKAAAEMKEARDPSPSAAAPAVSDPPEEGASPLPDEAPSSGESPRPRSSPAARRLAGRLGIPLTNLRGSGPRGRVMIADVQRQHEDGQPPPAAAPRRETLESGATNATAPVYNRPTGTAFVDLGPHGRLHYRRWPGAQPARRGTVLLIHGFAGDLTTWNAAAEFLAGKSFDVVAVDLPGHGATEGTASTPAECAETLLGALDSLGISADAAVGGLHLVGLSMGAVVATRLAQASPVKIASLTLLAPAALGTEINQEFLDGIVGAETVPALERELRKTTARPLPYASSALDRTLTAFRQEPRRQQLRALSRAFAHDGVQHRILRWQVALDLPGHVAIHLFDTGHMPHWEDPRGVFPVLAQLPPSN